ncbi:MAG: S41 family peptidase [Bacteroidales bacterium]
MRNKINKFLMSCIIILIGFSNVGYAQIFNEDMYKFGKALHFIDNQYIDSVDRAELVEEALKKIVDDLDPHTVYLTKEEVQEMNESLEGNFEGIGIEFNIHNDTIYVISPISGGPSEKVGIQAGDRIVKINDENVAGIGISTNGVRDRLLGEKGSKVNVTIKRPGVDRLLEFTIVRDKIPIHSLDAAYLTNNRHGYVKLNRFAQTTHEEFTEAVEQLREKGAQSLILDLRGNGGGYLDQAIKLADEFLAKDKLIVYTEGRNVERENNHATQEGMFENENIVILIDEGSASASEIVSGAVQDWDRGIIIGRRSFGKGLVQRPVSLPDGSMIRLTIARYHTPTGRAIQKPYDDDKKEYAKELLNRYNRGEMISADSINFPDSLQYRTKNTDRIVYGGGGIMPDIFMPLDTTRYSELFNDFVRQGILNAFVIDYIDQNRNKFKDNYPTFNEFKNDFNVDGDIMDELISFAEDEGIEIDGERKDELKESKNDLKLHIKALIARDMWDMSEYFQIVNKEDMIFQKANEILNNWDQYESEYLQP